jgi:hypothetical protein
MLALLLLPGALRAHDPAGARLDFTHAPKDVLPWGELAKVGVRRTGGRLEVDFLPPVRALEGKNVTLYGFMTPVAPGATHKRFLLSMHPLSCADCEQTTPEGIVEVNVRKPQATSSEPLAVLGKFVLVWDRSSGIIYRLKNAVVVRESHHGK